jgi:hypothetical protein
VSTDAGARPDTFFRNSWEGGGRASSWIDRLPVVFHARNGPASGFCFVEALVELADVGLAVIGSFALGSGVMDGEAESWAAACGGSLQHLEVAIGVAEGGNRASADMTLDAHRLALLRIAHHAAAVEADVPDADVIAPDNKDVRLVGLRLGRPSRRRGRFGGRRGPLLTLSGRWLLGQGKSRCL